MTFLKIVQGVTTPIRAYHEPAIMIIKGKNGIVQFTGQKNDQDEIWIDVLIDQNNFIEAGLAQFQIFEGGDLKSYGNVEVVPSLLVNPDQDLRSKYAIIVEAIQKTLAGVASKAQREISIGDKKIANMSADDLLRLLEYFKGKLDEEEAGNDVNPKTDQMKIKYVWSWR